MWKTKKEKEREKKCVTQFLEPDANNKNWRLLEVPFCKTNKLKMIKDVLLQEFLTLF